MSGDGSEMVGLGYCSPPIEVDENKLWEAMVRKIERPQEYLPVSDVESVAKPGFTWRTMVFKGSPIVEHIYADKATGEIRFVILDGEGKETDVEIINCLLRDPTRIEYYKRSVSTKERLEWEAPKAAVM
eukprot:CAMPEP_0181512212 /NCGR_PEP_ID=MMETSP1110-20121109/61849_1 /TAXON_ID=174948 /ORGANISM="Symbiodinium sp., Strain CCMP421" /LENGTH=128 /DNA_ID=CAMNT_0023642005 /DNA_START=13 /DNA_END=396 /DNA_ORIENTATION=-